MPKKLCTHGGCKEIVDHSDPYTSPRCDKHKGQSFKPQKKIKQHQLTATGDYFYRTKAWKALSARKRQLNPLCENCARYNKAVDADVVDHIKELEDLTEEEEHLKLDINNTQSLCHHCHNVKSAEERRKRLAKKRSRF